MNRKVRLDRILILVGSFIGVLILAIIFGKLLFSLINPENINTNKNNNINNDNQVEVIKKFSIELVDYKVYKIDDIDFNFVLARLRFKDTKAINYSIGSLYTDEKSIKLTDYKKYVDILESKDYYLGAQNVDYSIKSDDNSHIFTLFIPCNDKNKSKITLYDAVSKVEFTFDLNSNIGALEDLQYHTGNDELIQTEDYQIKVRNAYIENSFYQNGEVYNYPSTIQVYAFVLEINKLVNENIMIEDAVFIPDNTNEENKALDATITSMKNNNLISRKLKEGDIGALFFEMYNPNESGITYNGTLKIKFTNSENWLAIKTELN